MITDKEVRWFWNKWDIIIISWNMVSAFYLLSIPSITVHFFYDLPWWIWIYHAIIPINIFLKYVVKIPLRIWMFNDTVDGDFGAPHEIEKAGHTGKPTWFIILWWWFRNHSWNFIEMFDPTSNSSKSQVSEYRIFHDTRGTGNTEWLKEKGSFHICYRCKETGTVYCRYSKVTGFWEKHFGAGGDRFKLHSYPRK